MNNKYTYIIGKGGGSSEGSLRYDQPQELTAEQQKQAQENLGIDLSANLKREIVESLPSTGEDNIIYMVKRAETEGQNVYDEYMYINNAWEKIGSTDVDLSDYYTKEETDEKLEGYYTKEETDEKLEGYYTKEETDELINSIPKHWFGTQEEYDAIAEKDPNTIYHIEGGGIDVDDYYTKTEVDGMIESKANSADVYTKSEVYNKSEIDEKLDGINTILSSI